jgi:hypothetical protein
VNAALDLIVDTRDFPLEDITVRLLARVADLLVAVRARIDVGFLRADGAPRHDRVCIGVRQLPYTCQMRMLSSHFVGTTNNCSVVIITFIKSDAALTQVKTFVAVPATAFTAHFDMA